MVALFQTNTVPLSSRHNVALAVSIEVARAGNMRAAWGHARTGNQVRLIDLAAIPDPDGAVVVLPKNMMVAV